MTRLFRPEAIAHKTQRLHGAVVLTRTWSYPALTVFFCCIIAALIAFACLAGFTRKEAVSGIVVPENGVIRLAAPHSGIVTKVYAAEGQPVRTGDPVFILSTERTSQQGNTQAAVNDALAARIRHLRAELEQHGQQSTNKHQEIAQRLASLNASLNQLDSELALQRRKTQIVRELAGNLGELAREGSVSQNAASQKAAESIEQESRLAALESQRLALQRDIAALTALRSDLPLQSGREASQLQRGIEELKQEATENEARRELVIRAEQSGKVGGIVVEPGQSVSAEQRLGNLLPDGGALEAELYVPTRAAGFVSLGTEVLLRYDAFPYQKFGQFHGEVREVSATTVSLTELQRAGIVPPQLSSGGTAEPVYKVRVKLDEQAVRALGRLHALKPGMQLSASLVLERRTLVEWVLEPLMGMRAH